MPRPTVEGRAALSHAMQVLLTHHACTRKDILDTAQFLREAGLRSKDNRTKARMLFASELLGDIITADWET